MKVSIIMSCYNSQETVGRSIESILGQTYQDIELLVCDDGSIDNTLKILTDFEKADSRVKVYKNKKNLGLTKSLNILIDNSSGTYIARQDDDDISKSHRIKTQVVVLEELGLDFITSRANIIGKERYIPGLSFYFPISLIMNFKNPFIHGTLLIKKNVLKELGNYDENFYYAQDYKLFSDLIARGFKYTTLKEPLYKLNVKDNISSKFIMEQEYYARCVRSNEIPGKFYK
jgi:glycosyltransferase EpsE